MMIKRAYLGNDADGRLADHIGSVRRRAGDASAGRRTGNHRLIVLLDHLWNKSFQAVEHTPHVDVHHRLPARQILPRRCGPVGNPGIKKQQVHCAVVVHDGISELFILLYQQRDK